eukprot:CAMPEP_0181387334 /NCGR_PEP_ID=MMETSP1106-20121128/23659_1 /TAXON_ID=81844 /ORGANISM="Mantoniella antarctica, Strain SL-175" /LENGTH=119 /DNA_ID=CAMNT_0023507697 /DNA_START=205 /DNA_END=564 /DNA_ORIENTATION=+
MVFWNALCSASAAGESSFLTAEKSPFTSPEVTASMTGSTARTVGASARSYKTCAPLNRDDPSQNTNPHFMARYPGTQNGAYSASNSPMSTAAYTTQYVSHWVSSAPPGRSMALKLLYAG